MIEVEKKFSLTDAEIARLIEGATLVKKAAIKDVYYDDAAYTLTKQRMWLRSRDGAWELKTPVRAHDNWSRYEELTTEEGIKRALDPAWKGALSELLSAKGFEPIAAIETERMKYKFHDFTIDVDTADFGYDIAEIELMVATRDKVESAQKRIQAFAESRGLRIESVRGKIIEYIYRNDPEHFKALETAWGVKL